ncbi:hypothetical protein ATK23_1579 [Glutamicibacter mysorens]|uniref:Uncharacterized protein n=1 Tax=Glutamicibacter mysorens TaxID=257984 RepID=A0ABX4MZA3_9MICC|nr:hypothetical protein [Glutamicibacter mysorens]PJJ44348.1 hypothetical protein ATK23_1579 [Glutamicibacter mysorens]
MHAHAPNNRNSLGGNFSALWRGAVAAVAAGLFGTAIHASISYIGNDFPLVWGVLVAWLLLGVLVYWAAVSSAKLWAGAVAFIGCYVTVGLISYVGDDQLILGMQYYEYLPGPALASALWMYGMVIPSVIALLCSLRVLRKRQRQN